jgi:pimeloyl-ACP methyl ester carboxylesterase
MKTRNLLVISCALHLLATCITVGQGPTGAIIQLDETELQQWRLPAKVEMTVTGGASTEFAGSNNKLETGAPLFSEAPRKAGATFYRCDKVTGFPYRVNSIDPAPNRPGSSSFIAIKTEANGYRKTWICASVGAYKINGTTGNIMNWEYQVRYFSGDTNLNLPETITIGTVPNVPNYVGGAVTKYGVQLLENQPGISLHRLSPSSSDVRKDDAYGSPIRPLRQAVELSAEFKLGLGVVADGVTPVLVKATLPAALESESRFNLVLSTSDEDHSAGYLSNRVYSFRYTGALTGEGEFVKGLELVFPRGITNTYAYLEGIPVDSLESLRLNSSIAVGLKVQNSTIPESKASFQIVKPPIVLVHGYNSDRNTWSDEFLEELRKHRLPGFVRPIQYGVSPSGDLIANTTLPLKDLAPLLDSALSEAEAEYRRDWSFTRYDIVAHSQGGVLSRMLCSQGGTYSTHTPYASEDNAYRGRFHRVITIGSPHNGSRLAYYASLLAERIRQDMLSLSEEKKSQLLAALAQILGDLTGRFLPPKFYPFDVSGTGRYPEIVEVNMDPVDQRARFCLLQGTFEKGKSPTNRFAVCFGFPMRLESGTSKADTIGNVVLPSGSDGVVDLESQGALRKGSLTNICQMLNGSIVHFKSDFLYGDTPSETESQNVALQVIDLLNGPDTAFGRFYAPDSLTADDKRDIIAAAAGWKYLFVPLGLMLPPKSTLYSTKMSSQDSSVFSVKADFDPATLSTNGPIWNVNVYGPKGVTTEGVVIIGNPDRVSATVQVANSVIGDVVADMLASTHDGEPILGGPFVVFSRKPAGSLSSITLVPETTSLPIGASLSFEAWGEFSTGERMLLYTGTFDANSFKSEDTQVAETTSSGHLVARGVGSTKISLSYQNLHAEAQITVIAPSPSTKLTLAWGKLGDDRLSLKITSPLDQSIKLESSSNLAVWNTVTGFVSTNQETWVEVHPAKDGQTLFYRVSMSPLPSKE